MNLRSAYLASALMGAAVIAAPAAAQTTDWTKRVTQSPIGGHVMGNPLAKNRLVEYVSYTCNHCAAFEVASNKPLKSGFIAKGHVSAEVRNYVRDPVDFTAAILARCGGPSKFFGNHNALMASQNKWMATLAAASPEIRKSWYQGDTGTRLQKIATDIGFYDIMAKRGFDKTKADACLVDKKAQDQVLAMTKYGAETVKITGTPSFTINDKLINMVHAWSALQPVLAKLPTQ